MFHFCSSAPWSKNARNTAGPLQSEGGGPFFTGVYTYLGDLAKHSEFARSVDAVIGLDLLSSSNFTVDYAHRKIVFDAPIQRPNSTPDELSNCLILKIQVQGRPVRLILDTGFPGILLFEERLLTSVPGIRLTRDVFNVTLGTRLRAKQTVLENVAIGPTTKDVPVLLTKAPARHATRNRWSGRRCGPERPPSAF